MLKKVETHPSLARDSQSGAIINTDLKAFQQARQLKARAQSRDASQRGLEARINKLEEDISSIRDLLLEALGKK